VDVRGTVNRPSRPCKPYLIEEAYEVLDAMHEPEAHRRELGDLLLQIVFQSRPCASVRAHSTWTV
jgi:uncharacterized protein YabN with tetrapyrrole methylase and pyrophosphatase domain